MSRTYRDPIHNEIQLNGKDPVEALLIKLIDTKEVQRLRWIRQLGTGWFTFHGAEASRFGHSLGAMHIARMMINHIQKQMSFDEETFANYKRLVMVAALVHDIGHGPFSHSCERITNIKHEVWTRKILLHPDTEIHQELENHQEGFAEEIISVLAKTHPVKFICSIVSGQIDCDRFDYLIRDSYFTGTSYGHFDLNRVVSSITVNLDNDCLVVSGEKGMLAVEDYLYARYSMYLQVYQHKKCLASDFLLHKLFARARTITKTKRIKFIEKSIYNWLIKPEHMTCQDYLNIDDVCLLHHIKQWTTENDRILSDLARRFIYRKIFKARKIDNTIPLNKALEEKSQELKKNNYDPDYYMDSITIASNPYSFYNPDKSSTNNDGSKNFTKAIYVQITNPQSGKHELKEISELSHIVNSLVNDNFSNQWLITVD